MLAFVIDTALYRFPLIYCPADDTLFEVCPEIRCSGVSSRYCRYGNHIAGFRPI